MNETTVLQMSGINKLENFEAVFVMRTFILYQGCNEVSRL